jgi:hypothetical protein
MTQTQEEARQEARQRELRRIMRLGVKAAFMEAAKHLSVTQVRHLGNHLTRGIDFMNCPKGWVGDDIAAKTVPDHKTSIDWDFWDKVVEAAKTWDEKHPKKEPALVKVPR